MYAKILVPIDGSLTSKRGLSEAIGLARQLKCQLVLMTVVDDFPMTVEWASADAFEQTRRRMVQLGEDVLADGRRIAGEAGVPCETALREVTTERAADSIVSEAVKQGCELIVMGTHGRRGLNRLAMGSDAELVVRESPVPVLLVRNPDAPA
ncbi:MAG TPA: universal stress protein [Rhizobacter sp.]|nr:universal stress protein [Rhizobacter sp.]